MGKKRHTVETIVAILREADFIPSLSNRRNSFLKNYNTCMKIQSGKDTLKCRSIGNIQVQEIICSMIIR